LAATAKSLERYDKMHRGMFGEYHPVWRIGFRTLQLTPLTGGIVAGENLPRCGLDASICFSLAKFATRRDPARHPSPSCTLDERMNDPGPLVNLTNDAGTGLKRTRHATLACGVFRAVETRAAGNAANGGIIRLDRHHVGRVRAKQSKQQRFHHCRTLEQVDAKARTYER